jgi:dGTPase
MNRSIRERLEEEEDLKLHPRAARSKQSTGRERSEPPCPIRLAYQVDRDRILHSKSFRRLSQKTQVFLAPAGDHYRTRLTHTLEVSQIGRTLARALSLNENLTEAIALGHDLGHTPFGHAGEAVLAQLCPNGFHHAKQSLRVVETLEREGRGLNLTAETLEGIVKHSKGKGAILTTDATLEAQLVRVADVTAYLNHDLDDALRAGVITIDDLPDGVRKRLGESHGARISTIVADVIESSLACDLEQIALSSEIGEILVIFRTFLYDRVYDNPEVHKDFEKASKILEELYGYMMENSGWFVGKLAQPVQGATVEELVSDFIAGMTDRYAINLYESIFMPQPWKAL